jgi:hypothetical protein
MLPCLLLSGDMNPLRRPVFERTTMKNAPGAIPGAFHFQTIFSSLKEEITLTAENRQRFG